MSSSFKEIIPMAMTLPNAQRASLAQQLLESLDPHTVLDMDEHEKRWAEEIDRRCQDILNGTARTFSAEDTLKGIRKKFRV